MMISSLVQVEECVTSSLVQVDTQRQRQRETGREPRTERGRV